MNRFHAGLMGIAATFALSVGCHANAVTSTAPSHELPGGLEQVLGQLNLSDAQKTHIESLYEQAELNFQSLASVTQTTQRLLALTPPTDPDYAVILAAAKANAANGIQVRSDLWTKIYAALTPAQQAKLPAVFAADKMASTTRKIGRRSLYSAS